MVLTGGAYPENVIESAVATSLSGQLPADFSYRHMDLALDAGPRPRKRLARLLAPLSRRYDCIVLDCPPSISLVSESVFRAADIILSPLIPTPAGRTRRRRCAQGVCHRQRPRHGRRDR